MSGSKDLGLIHGYKPPGPVGAAFIQDVTHPLCGIMGPFGSGKTTACPVKAQHVSRLQPPSKTDGWIRSQGYVVRSTYRQLWDKTIPSFTDVFPVSSEWPMEGPRNGPARQIVRWRGRRPGDPSTAPLTVFEMIVNFVALGDSDIEEFARGQLATWYWLNEADTIVGDAVGSLLGRLHRYPPPHLLPDKVEPGFGVVMCDFNAPNVTNWTYDKFFRNPTAGAKCYVQPSGFDPAAENPELRKLNPSYYPDLAANMEEWQVKRFIGNEIGYSRTGQPIYGMFDRARHVAEKQLRPWNGLPILWGVDGASSTAAVAGQKHWDGRRQDLQSIVTPDGEFRDARTQGRLVREAMSGEYAGFAAVAMLDPSCWARNSVREEDPSWAEEFQDASGVPCMPAPTNDIGKRIKAVIDELNATVGSKAALQIDPFRNDTLIDGFTASYRIKKLGKGDDSRHGDKPDKNHASHVHDGRQYLALLRGTHTDVVDQMIELQADRLRAVRGDPGMGQVLNDW